MIYFYFDCWRSKSAVKIGSKNLSEIHEITPTTSADEHQVPNEILTKMDKLGVWVYLLMNTFFEILFQTVNYFFSNTIIIWKYFRSTLTDSLIKLERTREALKKLSDCVGVTRVSDSSDSSDNESNLSSGSQIRVEQHDADFGTAFTYTTNVSLYILLIIMDTTTVFFHFGCFTL